MSATCPPDGSMVTTGLNRVLTQYRESPKLLRVIENNLQQVEEATQAVCAIPDFFDINSAVGDQLTLLGKRLGWPRCHCVCVASPVFGFVCQDVPSNIPLVGFCENGNWFACSNFGVSEICLNDDETYRNFLYARQLQILNRYDPESLTSAIQRMWGPTAWIVDAGHGRVVMSPGRTLTAGEQAILQLVPRVLPVPLGIRQRFHFYTGIIFGFGEGWGGFCEPLYPDGTALTTETGEIIEGFDDPNEFPIETGPITIAADWLCEIDVQQCA